MVRLPLGSSRPARASSRPAMPYEPAALARARPSPGSAVSALDALEPSGAADRRRRPAAARPAGQRAARSATGHLRRRTPGAALVVRRPRRAGLPGTPAGRPRLVGTSRRRSRTSTRCPGSPPRRARGGLSLRHADAHRAPRGGRWPDRQGAPPARRRPRRRVGAHALPGARLAARAHHALHLEPGRLRRGLPVLRHRRARLLARPR